MKKLVVVFLLVFLFPIKVLAISAESSIVMDLDNGRIIHANNIDNEHLIASITKIMTAVVTLEYGDIDKEVTVGEEVLKAYGSAIYIEVGEKLTLKDLLMGLMLRSGNDAAVVIAKSVAGSMEAFVTLMNEEASKIGMTNTKFLNNHGLEEDDGSGNISTARDMALLTKYAMQNETFREIFGTKSYTLKTNYKSYSWQSKNKLIHQYDFITGGKTGYTKKAHRTLVTTAQSNNVSLVVVTLDDGNDFSDHLQLYKKYFKEYESVNVIKKDNVVIKNDNIYKNDKLYLDRDLNVIVTNSEKNKIKVEYEMYDNKNYLDGDVVGYASVYIDKELVTKRAIYVKKEEFTSKKSLWDKFLEWFKW